MSSRERLDLLLVGRGLAPSRERAQRWILAGLVRVDGERVTQVGRRIREGAAIVVDRPEHEFVSRGGVKLAAALDAFGIDPEGRVCLDVGASTGGFTDCLLSRGARCVHALDVGYGQLAWKLRRDPRVKVRERTNVRHLEPRSLEPPPSLAAMDASFISLRLLLGPTAAQLVGDREIVALVKPQFEVGRERVGRGGVVDDPAARDEAVASVAAAGAGLGFDLRGVVRSPLVGAKKRNVEIFVHLAARPGTADG